MNKKAKQNHEPLYHLFEDCYIDPINGRFHCKKCDNLIHVNLSQRIVFCSAHGMLIEEGGHGIFI